MSATIMSGAASAAPAAGKRRARISVSPLVAVLALMMVVAVLPPFVFLVMSSVHTFEPDGTYGSFTLQHFQRIFSDGRLWPLIVNSALYSLGSAVLALVVGAAQAWLAERTDAPFRPFLYFAAIVSLGVPYVLFIAGWLLFLGKAGPVNASMQALFGGAGPYVNIYSLGGMIFIEGMIWSPLAFLLLSSVFRNSDAAYEEAAIKIGRAHV